MDPGSFGAVTITKALTIAGDGVLAGILGSGVSGIIVNAGANDVVYIRNRSINGAGNDESESCEDQTPITVIQSPAAGTPIGLGTHTITLTANDGSSSNVANPPTLNAVNAGKAVPVKFSLSGDKGLNIFAANNPYSVSLNCGTNNPGVDVTETLNAGGSSLTFSGDQYIYIWKTESSWAGTCRQLVITLNDGSVHTANFKFT